MQAKNFTPRRFFVNKVTQKGLSFVILDNVILEEDFSVVLLKPFKRLYFCI